MITIENVEHVAALSMLDISSEDKEALRCDLDAVVTHFENLKGLDTENVEPTTYILPQQNIFREDVVVPSPGREALMENAPECEDGCFIVPRVVE